MVWIGVHNLCNITVYYQGHIPVPSNLAKLKPCRLDIVKFFAVYIYMTFFPMVIIQQQRIVL